MKGWRRAAHLAGTGLAICGIYFVFQQLREYGDGIDASAFSRTEWATFASLTLFGVIMNACLGMAWRACLRGAGAVVPTAWGLSTYGMTHLARYVPGNIFHYAGRQAMGMAAGIPGRALAKASVLELGLVTFSGGLTALVSLPLIFSFIPEGGWFPLVALLIALAAFCLRRILGPPYAVAFGLYVVYLTMSGMIFLAVAAAHDWNSIADHDWTAICGAYIAAWLIGMLTPGAPAGLGVRELVLLYIFKGRMDGEVLIFSVLMTRVIAVFADLLTYVGALVLRHFSTIGAKRES